MDLDSTAKFHSDEKLQAEREMIVIDSEGEELGDKHYPFEPPVYEMFEPPIYDNTVATRQEFDPPVYTGE